MRRLIVRNKRRRIRKKRRLVKMSRTKRVFRRIGILGTWLLAIFAVVLVGLVTLFYSLSNVPRPEDVPLAQVATIQYSDGSTLAKIGTTNRSPVSLDKVPRQVRWDVVAAEDRNFYHEPGVSVKGTLRAAIDDLTGGDTQGGSGITQQYAKNAYLSDARTLSRKLKELMISIKLARNYSKNQILEYYLNTVYFGRGAYGIQAAAHTYFGRDVSKLDVAQGAVLAALLRAPSYYDPAAHPHAAKQRWHYVLDGMVAIHRLTRAKADALSYPKVKRPSRNSQLGAAGWKHFIVAQVKRELVAHNISEAEINQRGLTVRTTINKHAQHAAVHAINKTFAHLTKKQKNLKNALVAIKPSTGGVLAYYGGKNGKDYNGKKDYNDYAGIGTRPPGSSFKPYVLSTVLTQTLHKASGKRHLAIDSYVNGSYCVHIEKRKICNDPGDEGVSNSSVTIANAMKYSLNTTFDLLAEHAGPDNVAATAHRMGIPQRDANGNKLLVGDNGRTGFGIGIGDYPISPLDQAAGYATLDNHGISNAPYFVARATDSSGNLIYKHKADPHHAINKKVANDVTLTLEPVSSWAGFSLSHGRKSAAKTGTEGIFKDKTGNNSDAWTAGYTPQVAAAVWTGSGNSTTPIYNANGLPEYGKDLPGTTWKRFMDTYLRGKPKLHMPTKQQIHGGRDVAPAPRTYVTTRSVPTLTHSAPSGPSSTPIQPSSPPSQPSTSAAPTLPVQPTGPPSQPNPPSASIAPPPSEPASQPASQLASQPASTCTPGAGQRCP